VDTPRPPDSLSPAWWARQAQALAAARPAAVDERLAALERQCRQLDYAPFEPKGLTKPADAEERLAQLAGDFGRTLRAVADLAKAVESAAARWQAQHKSDAKAKAALAAAATLARDAASYRTALGRFPDAAKAELTRRLAELRAAAPAPADEKKPDSPERARVRTRMLDQLRIVKMRRDRKVHFLACIGRNSSAVYLHSSPVSDAQKPLLVKVLQGDTGFKWYRGECVWEEGTVTFVGNNLSATLGRRIQEGANELVGGNVGYRIRATAEKV
jgi:hypothetical protein